MHTPASWLAGLVLLVVLAGAAGAATGTPSDHRAPQGRKSIARQTAKKSARPGGLSEMVDWDRLAWGTAAVVALGCLGVYALKKLNKRPGAGRYLEVLETRRLGRKFQLFLIRVGSRVVLIACQGDTVACVAELEQDELPEREEQTAGEGNVSFRWLLQSFVGGKQ